MEKGAQSASGLKGLGEKTSGGCPSVLGDDPDGVNDSRNISKNRQQQVYPEVFSDADLEKNPQGRNENGDQYAQQVHVYALAPPPAGSARTARKAAG